jgi:hypothetical protein
MFEEVLVDHFDADGVLFVVGGFEDFGSITFADF